LLVEVAEGCGVENLYLDVLEMNMNAAMDIGFTFNEPKEPGPRGEEQPPKIGSYRNLREAMFGPENQRKGGHRFLPAL
jgi:hypothetical protein